MSDAEEAAITFVRAWGEAVLRTVERVADVRRRAAALNRELDRVWDRDGEATLTVIWRENWTEEHTLIWALHQLERWVARLAVERGEEAPQENVTLRNVRNALEHLDEAELPDDATAAVAGDNDRRNRSLRTLPGGQLYIATGGRIFGAFDLRDLAAIAQAQVDRVDLEATARHEASVDAAADSYADKVIDERRDTP
ncbi:hypothetical protein ACIA49_32930 [Kribbella sp. NPDC051587]|uniref:hypothetical protein n=1 Tax=Kribbella sp. NPDC051587 TaxID=3364119 RepID=UPI0037A35BD8